MIRMIRVKIQSQGTYSQGRPFDTPKKDKESADAYDERCWRDRAHINNDGYVYIPPLVFKNCLSEAAKYLSIQIPGKGKQTYTKNFEAGVMVTDPLVLPIKRDELLCNKLYVPADGQRGGSKRVWRRFPIIPDWSGELTFYVLDPTITTDVFMTHLSQAGQFIGIGVFRPRNNGLQGRFSVELLESVDMGD